MDRARYSQLLGVLMGIAALCAASGARALVLAHTDFEGFTPGSVNGQGGWSSTGTFDQEVTDFAGSRVLRISNAVTAGSFGDQPFAPRPGGVPTDSVNDPVNSSPASFAGESSTGAAFDRFSAAFDFRSATGAAQPGLSVTVSGDNGSGARHGFFDIEDNGAGLDIITFDLDAGGNYIGPITIATGLDYTGFHNVAIELLFDDGPFDDVANYYVDGALVHTGQSWESFYSAFQPAEHPLGVPVQTLIFRVSGTAAAGTRGGGYFFDNVTTALGDAVPVPAPETATLLAPLAGALVARRRRRRVA